MCWRLPLCGDVLVSLNFRCAVAAGLADAAEMFVESYGELVKPKHEHVHDCLSRKILIRVMCTIDDEMSPNRYHDVVE